MIRNLIVASALAGSLLASTTASMPAQAATTGGGWHRGFGPMWLVPPVAVGAYYAGSYYGGCGWLYRRAAYTGSPYWWHRYHECVAW
jgi:hypothetical protein